MKRATRTQFHLALRTATALGHVRVRDVSEAFATLAQSREQRDRLVGGAPARPTAPGRREKLRTVETFSVVRRLAAALPVRDRSIRPASLLPLNFYPEPLGVGGFDAVDPLGKAIRGFQLRVTFEGGTREAFSVVFHGPDAEAEAMGVAQLAQDAGWAYDHKTAASRKFAGNVEIDVIAMQYVESVVVTPATTAMARRALRQRERATAAPRQMGA